MSYSADFVGLKEGIAQGATPDETVMTKYDQKISMVGSIDKHVLRMTKADIRNELEYKMQPLIRQGGIIFGLDHRIPNGTPLENYRYYVDLGREILGLHPRNSQNQGWPAFCGASIL